MGVEMKEEWWLMMGVESKERVLRKKMRGLGLRFGYTAMVWTWV